MSRSSTKLSLSVLRARRRTLLRQMARIEPVLLGNVYDVMRRCGNPSCHCATQPGHRQTLWIFTEKGRRRCKFIRRQDAEWVKRAWRRYRDCRKALREIRAINQRELALLRAQIHNRRVRYE